VLYCFVTNPKNLPAIFLYHILITANMQSKTGFPSSHQFLRHPKSRSKFAARCPVSGCWPSVTILLSSRSQTSSPAGRRPAANRCATRLELSRHVEIARICLRQVGKQTC